MARMGDLEREVMEVLWAADEPRTVREVQDALPGRGLAYTTVMTVLDRLGRKDLVTRERDGRAFRYRAAHDREDLTAELMREALASAGQDRTPALVRFAEQVSPAEAEALRSALDRVVAADAAKQSAAPKGGGKKGGSKKSGGKKPGGKRRDR